MWVSCTILVGFFSIRVSCWELSRRRREMWFFVADLAFLCRLLLCCASSSFFTLLLCYWCLGSRHARKMLGLTWLNLLNQSDRNYNFRLGNLIMIFCIGVTHPFVSWRTGLRAVHHFVEFASATKSCHLWEVQLHMTQDEARAHFREARNLLRISFTSTCFFFLSRSHWLCLSLVTRLESFHHIGWQMISWKMRRVRERNCQKRTFP